MTPEWPDEDSRYDPPEDDFEPHATFEEDDFAQWGPPVPSDEVKPSERAEPENVAYAAIEDATGRDFEDLTLAELVGQFVRAPRATLRATIAIAREPVYAEGPAYDAVEEHEAAEQKPPAVRRTVEPRRRIPIPAPQAIRADARRYPTMTLAIGDQRREIIRFGLYVVALILGIWGHTRFIIGEYRNEQTQLAQGAPFVIAAFLVWLGAEVFANWPNLRDWWTHRGERAEALPRDQFRPFDLLSEVPLYRVLLFGASVLFAASTWVGTANNEFTFVGFWSWVLSVIAMVVALAPEGWNPLAGIEAALRRLRQIDLRKSLTFWALVAVMIAGAYMRFADFNGVPPEMTSDHKEKLVDSQRVVDGNYDVFFASNGGREAAQFYLMALMSKVPGLGMNFETLKLLAIIEGLVTLPFLWWMGREVVGEHNRKLGNVVGLILAALVAVSYWHTTITRLSLRIVLTPLVMTLLTVYLVRGIRYNRRGDFIKAGLVLGYGLYTYQAIRMAPVVVLAGVGLAILYHFRDRRAWLRYTLNLTALVIVSAVIFVPSARYWYEFPDSYWMRTSGRLFGDDLVYEENDAGVLVARETTMDERLDAFQRNVGVLARNVRNALLMYNWQGDVAWFQSVSNMPAMDQFTGTLLAVGVAAWLVFALRRRDPALVLVMVTVVIMLLPSALSIAQPDENPSATRTSGSLHAAYLIAAFPLGLMALQVERLVKGRAGTMAATGLVVLFVALALVRNSDLYLHDYKDLYERSWFAHSEPGNLLRDFAESEDRYGNVFLISERLDYTIIGIYGGAMSWPHGVPYAYEVPNRMYDSFQCRVPADRYKLDPDTDLLFIYTLDNREAEGLLRTWFPEGQAATYNSYQVGDDFRYYVVPPLGEARLQEFFDTFTTSRRC